MSLKIRIRKKVNIDSVIFFVVMFYIFCMDYAYLALPALNIIMNSKFVGIIVAVLILYELIKNVKVFPQLVFLLYLFVILCFAFSLLLSEDISYITNEIINLHNLKNIVMIPAFLLTINSPEIYNKRMYKFSIFALLFYATIYYLYFTKIYIDGGFYENYGMYLGFCSTFFWLVILQDGFAEKKVFDFVFDAIFALLIISFGSRSVILVMGVGTMIFLYVYWGEKNKIKKSLIILIFFCAGIILYTFFDKIIQLLINLLGGFSNLGRTLWYLKNGTKLFEADGRDAIWGTCLDEIINHPLKIRGIGGDVEVISKALGKNYYAHNFILELVLEFGLVIGIVLVLLYIIMIARIFLSDKGSLKKALMPAAINSTVVLFFSLNVWICPWLWMCMVMYINWIKTGYRISILQIKKGIK